MKEKTRPHGCTTLKFVSLLNLLSVAGANMHTQRGERIQNER